MPEVTVRLKGREQDEELVNLNGRCPRCAGNDGAVLIEGELWFMCFDCRTRWLFPSSMYESVQRGYAKTDEEYAAIEGEVATFAKVRALRPCRPWILDAYMKSVTSATYNEGRDAIFSRDRERFARALMARGTALEVEIKAGRAKRALIDLGFSTGGVSEGIRYLQSVIDDRWRKPGAADKIFARAVEMLEAGKDAAESVH